MVERFSVPSKGRGHPVVLLRRPNDGEFVRYSDYTELEAKVERLKIGIKKAEEVATQALSRTGVVKEIDVMVCPQCEGEGSYADGLDDAACTTTCTRCESNGWIVNLAPHSRDTDTVEEHADFGHSPKLKRSLELMAQSLSKRPAELRGLSRAGPVVEVEPVAWAYEYHNFGDVWVRHVILNRPDGGAKPPAKHHGSPIRNVRPLYAHPTKQAVTEEMAEAARNAADDALWMWRGLGERQRGEGLDGMHFVVRAALESAMGINGARVLSETCKEKR